MEKILFSNIGENFHRGIETALVFLDENLCKFEKLIKGNGIKSVFYVEKNNLSSEQRRKIFFEIEKIKKTLKEIKDALKFMKSGQTSARLISVIYPSMLTSCSLELE